MELKEYLVESKRTMADVFHLKTDVEHRLLHGAIGIVTEIGELFEAIDKREVDIINIGEEIADCYWYMAIIQREYNFEVDTFSKEYAKIGFSSMEDLLGQAFVIASNILDMFKKKAYYNRNLDAVALVEHTQKLNYCFLNLLDWIGIPLDVVLRNNIEKLRVRFPEKFCEDHANVRNLDAEREKLEQ